MGNKLVEITPGVDISVSYPTGTVPSIVDAASTAVISIGTALLKNGIFATGAIIESWEETSSLTY